MSRPIECLVLVTYDKFTDGTEGSILIVNWEQAQPAIFLFNSPTRQKNNPNAKRKHLFPEEHNMLLQYINEYEKITFPEYNNKIAYGKYGVARLCGNFESAHIADIICENINKSHPGIHEQTDRVNNRIGDAYLNYRNRILEDELLWEMDEVSQWERSILGEVWPKISPNYNHQEWLNQTLEKIRTAFIDNLEQKLTAGFGVDYGYRLATAYAKNNDVKWWRVLEEAVSMRHQEDAIKYANFGFQEIIAFYGLAKYIAAKKPWNQLTLSVENVPLQKRIELFDLYKKSVEKECLEELHNMDNPELSQLPTKQDAQKVAKERRILCIGKVPEWLPEEVRQAYCKYEQAFCKDIIEGLDTTIHKGFEAYIIKDHKKVMSILMFVAHLGNGQMPLMIKVIQALQELKYIKADCFGDLPSFIRNAQEQFKNINFDKSNVKHQINPRIQMSTKSHEELVKTISIYLKLILEG